MEKSRGVGNSYTTDFGNFLKNSKDQGSKLDFFWRNSKDQGSKLFFFWRNSKDQGSKLFFLEKLEGPGFQIVFFWRNSKDQGSKFDFFWRNSKDQGSKFSPSHALSLQVSSLCHHQHYRTIKSNQPVVTSRLNN
jgi:hypothetical protein